MHLIVFRVLFSIHYSLSLSLWLGKQSLQVFFIRCHQYISVVDGRFSLTNGYMSQWNSKKKKNMRKKHWITYSQPPDVGLLIIITVDCE